MEKTGYRQELEAEGEIEAETRMENIEELINKAVSYEEDSEHPTLDEFLEQVALVADIDSMDDSEERVTLMTRRTGCFPDICPSHPTIPRIWRKSGGSAMWESPGRRRNWC